MASRVGRPSPPALLHKAHDLQALGDAERTGRAADGQARQLVVHLRVGGEVADPDAVEIARGGCP